MQDSLFGLTWGHIPTPLLTDRQPLVGSPKMGADSCLEETGEYCYQKEGEMLGRQNHGIHYIGL